MCQFSFFFLSFTENKQTYKQFLFIETSNIRHTTVFYTRKHASTSCVFLQSNPGNTQSANQNKESLVQGGAEPTDTFQMVTNNTWKEGKISEIVYKYVQVCYLLPTDYKLIF